MEGIWPWPVPNFSTEVANVRAREWRIYVSIA